MRRGKRWASLRSTQPTGLVCFGLIRFTYDIWLYSEWRFILEEYDIEQMNNFLTEFQNESDRGAPLVAAALLEQILYRILDFHFIDDSKISANMLKGESAPLGSFSAKIIACRALGLITEEERKYLDIIRKIRNKFAHEKHGISFSSDSIKDMCLNLPNIVPSSLGDMVNDPRKRFNLFVAFFINTLWYRPEYALPFKAKDLFWRIEIDYEEGSVIYYAEERNDSAK